LLQVEETRKRGSGDGDVGWRGPGDEDGREDGAVPECGGDGWAAWTVLALIKCQFHVPAYRLNV
jgi:hypothetical protein